MIPGWNVQLTEVQAKWSFRWEGEIGVNCLDIQSLAMGIRGKISSCSWAEKCFCACVLSRAPYWNYCSLKNISEMNFFTEVYHFQASQSLEGTCRPGGTLLRNIWQVSQTLLFCDWQVCALLLNYVLVLILSESGKKKKNYFILV